jgi:hypothetical protein
MKRLFSIPAIGLVLASLLASKLSSAQTYFTVDVKGKGKPMILIHGLYCSGDVWKETVERYQKEYECHVVTLAGFGGNAPHLSLWAASSASEIFGKVIAVDGAPFLSALMMPNATAESAKGMATQARDGMSNQTPEQIKQSQKMMLPSLIADQKNIDLVTDIAMKADSKTQGQVMYELFTTDLRPVMASVENPVLVMGAWIAYKNYGSTHDSVKKNYSDQLAAAKNVSIEISDTARHFIFYDDPSWFFEKMDAFLK